MRALVLETLSNQPSEKLYEKEIEGTLESFQELIGGYIEVVDLVKEAKIYALVDEDGMLKRRPMNITGLFGTVAFVSIDDSGDFIELDQRQKHAVINAINEAYRSVLEDIKNRKRH